jgi:hypothetical protein
MGIKYEYDLSKGWSFAAIKAFRLSAGDYFYPSLGGLFFTNNGTWINPWDPNLSVSNSYVVLDGDTLKTEWEALYTTSKHEYNFIYKMDFVMIGRTLKTHLYSLQQGDANFQYYAIDLDRSDSCYLPFLIEVPGLSDMNILLTNGVYTSMFFDWTKANASDIYPHDTIYNYPTTSVRYSQRCYYSPNTSGVRKPLNETVYLTVSPNIDEVLPNIPNPVSIYKDSSASKIVMDWWSSYFYLYKDAAFLKALYRNSIDNVWAIIHDWQQWGYDTRLPDTYPASTIVLNGQSEPSNMDSLRSWIDSCPNHNYYFSLHENYTSVSTNSGSYWTNYYKAKNPNGDSIVTWDMGWFDPGNTYKLYLMKPSRIKTPLQLEAAPTHSFYRTNSSYLDFHTNARLGAFVDYDGSMGSGENYGSYRATMEYYKELGDTLKLIHDGPVSAEGGAFMSYYVGYFDDFEGEIRTNVYPSLCQSCGSYIPGKRGGFFRPLLVNYDLRVMHKKSFMHGVGYKARFFQNNSAEGYAEGRSMDSLLMYAATEFAYGRGGQFSSFRYDNSNDSMHRYLFLQDAKLQHSHILPMQKYLKDQPSSIEYYDFTSSSFKSASDYLRDHPNTYNNFDHPAFMGQVKIQYTNGTIVYVNRSNTNTWTITGIPSNRVWYSYHKTGGGSDTLYSGTGNPGSSMVLPKQSGWLALGPLCSECPDDEQPIDRGGKKFTFSLSQNYPNPFNPTTLIKYSIAKPEFVTVKIFDILGRELMSLENTFKDAGEYEINFDGRSLASGMYFYQINTKDYTNTKKMLLIK